MNERPPPLLVAAVIGLLVVSVASSFSVPLRSRAVQTSVAPLQLEPTTATTSTTADLALPEAAPGELVPVGPPGSDGGPPTTSTSNPSEPSDPTRPRPPAHGVYRYHYVIDGEDEGISKVGVRAGPASAGPDALDVTDYDDGTIDHWRWGSESVVLRSSSLGLEPGDERCEWQPTVRLYSIPMTAGTAWSNDSRCTATTEDGTITVQLVTRSTVLRAQQVTVARERVDTWVIEHNVTVEVSGSSEGEQFRSRTEEHQTEYFSPRHGIEVSSDSKRTQTDTGPDGEDSYEETEHRELLALQPASR